MCLEPCYFGFCVGLYKRFSKARYSEIVAFKQCTRELGYDTDLFGISERSEKTWNNAIRIAQEIINKYFINI